MLKGVVGLSQLKAKQKCGNKEIKTAILIFGIYGIFIQSKTIMLISSNKLNRFALHIFIDSDVALGCGNAFMSGHSGC